MVAEVRGDGQRFKVAEAGWPRRYGTQAFKLLIGRQRRPAFHGRYEQTVDDVCSRLPQLPTKGVWLGEPEQRRGRRKEQKEGKATL